jgi:addiction module HigA family antidote
MWKLSTTIKGISADPRAVLRVPALPKNRNAAGSIKTQQKTATRGSQHDHHKPRGNAKSAKWDSVHNWHISARRISHKARMAAPPGRHRARLPDRITAHPGEILREEFLKPLGLSVNGLAAALRVPSTRIGAIIKGERSVTPDTALRLARFFSNSPEFWINLQAMHDLTRARLECGRMVEREVCPRVR